MIFPPKGVPRNVDDWLDRPWDGRPKSARDLLNLDGGGCSAEEYARRQLYEMGVEPEDFVSQQGRLLLLLRLLAKEPDGRT